MDKSTDFHPFFMIRCFKKNCTDGVHGTPFNLHIPEMAGTLQGRAGLVFFPPERVGLALSPPARVGLASCLPMLAGLVAFLSGMVSPSVELVSGYYSPVLVQVCEDCSPGWKPQRIGP